MPAPCHAFHVVAAQARREDQTAVDTQCFGTHHTKTPVCDADGEGGARSDCGDLEITWGKGERFDLRSPCLRERGPNRLVCELWPQLFDPGGQPGMHLFSDVQNRVVECRLDHQR